MAGQGVIVVPGHAVGLLWHPLPLPPGGDGVPMDPAGWAARLVSDGRWGLGPRPPAGWVPPDPTWGDPVLPRLQPDM